MVGHPGYAPGVSRSQAERIAIFLVPEGMWGKPAACPTLSRFAQWGDTPGAKRAVPVADWFSERHARRKPDRNDSDNQMTTGTARSTAITLFRESLQMAVATGAAPAVSCSTNRRVCCFSSRPWEMDAGAGVAPARHAYETCWSAGSPCKGMVRRHGNAPCRSVTPALQAGACL